MRITLDIDDDLLNQANVLAEELGCTLSTLVEQGIRLLLAKQNRHTFELPTFGGGGLMPSVDLDNNAALLDLMEADDDSEQERE
jgi:hypothetical protein